MDDLAFVEGLALAGDRRLEALRHAPPAAFEGVRRGPERAGAAPLVDESWRAAVNGGAVVSFVAGLGEAAMRDVLLSTQFAQRAASARHDRQRQAEAWYGLYGEVLERLGWVGEGFAFTERRSTAGTFTLDRSALDVVAVIATGAQLAILVKALDTLRGLADETGAIRVFELQALAELSGNFQLGSVEQAANGALALALGGFHFVVKDQRRGVLFAKWGSEEVRFWAAAAKLTLNAAHFAPLRPTVEAKLGTEAATYLVGLKVV